MAWPLCLLAKPVHNLALRVCICTGLSFGKNVTVRSPIQLKVKVTIQKCNEWTITSNNQLKVQYLLHE